MWIVVLEFQYIVTLLNIVKNVDDVTDDYANPLYTMKLALYLSKYFEFFTWSNSWYKSIAIVCLGFDQLAR